MKTNATMPTLTQAASSAGVALAPNSTPKRFTLKPRARARKYRRLGFSRTQHGRRHINAVCWHGHREFFRSLFQLEPTATVWTSMATYRGVDGFMENFEATAHQQVGSYFDPAEYADLCDCDE